MQYRAARLSRCGMTSDCNLPQLSQSFEFPSLRMTHHWSAWLRRAQRVLCWRFPKTDSVPRLSCECDRTVYLHQGPAHRLKDLRTRMFPQIVVVGLRPLA